MSYEDMENSFKNADFDKLFDESAKRAEEYQQNGEQEYRYPKAFYNGLAATGRGVLGWLQALEDKNTANNNKLMAPFQEKFNIEPEKPITAYEEAANNWRPLQDYRLVPKSNLDEFGLNVASGAGQFVGQGAATVLTGGAGGTLAMLPSIAGNEYLELKGKGVDQDVARNASLANYVAQALLEYKGLSKMFSRIPAKTPLKNAIKIIAERFATEGVTEGVQEIPEQLSRLYAENPDATVGDILSKWWDNRDQNLKDVANSAIVGGTLGVLGGGVNDAILKYDFKPAEKVNAEPIFEDEIVPYNGNAGNNGSNPNGPSGPSGNGFNGSTVDVETEEVAPNTGSTGDQPAPGDVVDAEVVSEQTQTQQNGSSFTDKMRALKDKIPFRLKDLDPNKWSDTDTACVYTIGKAMEGTPFEGTINVDQLEAKGKELGLIRSASDYTPQPGDIAIVNNGAHAVMINDDGGIIQNGKSAGGVYESKQTVQQMFGGADYYIATSNLNGATRRRPEEDNVFSMNDKIDYLKDNQLQFDEITNNAIEEAISNNDPNKIDEVFKKVQALNNVKDQTSLNPEDVIKEESAVRPTPKQVTDEAVTNGVVPTQDTPIAAQTVTSEKQSPQIKPFKAAKGQNIEKLANRTVLVALQERVNNGTASPYDMKAYNALRDDVKSALTQIVDNKQQAQANQPVNSVSNVGGNYGVTAKLTTDNGTEFDAQYKIVDADDLVMSHNPSNDNFSVNDKYPKDLQPRNRESMAMRQQVYNMASNLRPADLMDSRNLNSGAPLVNKNNVVENGNGRSMAIYRALKGKNASSKAYRQALYDNAERLGISKEQIDSVKNPVLVRERQSDNVDIKEIIQSTAGGARLSATEQGKVDATKLKDSTLRLFVPNDKGDLLSAANEKFMRAALNDIAGNDLNALVTSKGEISQQGVLRVKAALFAKAFNDDGLLARMTESTDDDIKNVTNALVAVAPNYAQMNNDINNGHLNPIDIVTPIVEGARKFAHLVSNDENIKTYLLQAREGALFSGIPQENIDIVEFLNDFRKSAKKMREAFNDMYEGVYAQGDPSQLSLLAPLEVKTTRTIIQESIAEAKAKEERSAADGNNETQLQDKGNKANGTKNENSKSGQVEPPKDTDSEGKQEEVRSETEEEKPLKVGDLIETEDGKQWRLTKINGILTTFTNLNPDDTATGFSWSYGLTEPYKLITEKDIKVPEKKTEEPASKEPSKSKASESKNNLPAVASTDATVNEFLGEMPENNPKAAKEWLGNKNELLQGQDRLTYGNIKPIHNLISDLVNGDYNAVERDTPNGSVYVFYRPDGAEIFSTNRVQSDYYDFLKGKQEALNKKNVPVKSNKKTPKKPSSKDNKPVKTSGNWDEKAGLNALDKLLGGKKEETSPTINLETIQKNVDKILKDRENEKAEKEKKLTPEDKKRQEVADKINKKLREEQIANQKEIDEAIKKHKEEQASKEENVDADEEIDLGEGVLDDNDLSEAEAIRAKISERLKAQRERVNANPFDFETLGLMLKYGMIKIQKGLKNLNAWKNSMVEDFGEAVKPYLKSVWEAIKSYPKGKKFNGDVMNAVMNVVGSNVEKGKTLTEIKDMLNTRYPGADMNTYVDSAYQGVANYPIENQTQEDVQSNQEEKQKGANDNVVHSTKENPKGNNGLRDTKNSIRENADEPKPIRGNGEGMRPTGSRGEQLYGSNGVSGSGTTISGETTVREGEGEVPTVIEHSSGNIELSGSVEASYNGESNVDRGPTPTDIRANEVGQANETNKIKKEEAKKEEKDTGDIPLPYVKEEERRALRKQEIANEMPFLTQGQVDNVDFAEERFYGNDDNAVVKAPETGVMFTDGTGTGKTFTGLAIAKRMIKEGKKNIVVIAPGDKVIKQWIDAAKGKFKIDLTQLENVKDAGNGAVITTFANLKANNSLVGRNVDCVICDEAQNLLNNEKGTVTAALEMFRGLTEHNRGLRKKAEAVVGVGELRKRVAKNNTAIDKAKALAENAEQTEDDEAESTTKDDVRSVDELKQENAELEKKIKELKPQVDEKVKELKAIPKEEKPKVVFLSATPFAYDKDIDYAEGYLFDYPEENTSGAYNSAGGR